MTRFPIRAQRTFAPEATSVSQARVFTRETLEGWGARELVDSASLIVSELMTNAVVHTGTPARLTLWMQGHDLRVEVEDRHPNRFLPFAAEQPPPVTAEHGRGLLITTSLSSSWGVEYAPATKRVWALFSSDGAEAPARAPTNDVRSGGRAPRVGVVEVAADGTIAAWNGDATALFGWTTDEAVGRAYVDLVDPAHGLPPEDLGAPDGPGSWQGSYTVLASDGAGRPVFASHRRTVEPDGSIVLLVAVEQQALLEPPPPEPTPVLGTGSISTGLRDEALVRLGAEEYLALAAERARDAVAADATYVLLAHDFDDDLEVVAVSGLPEELLGSRQVPGSPGTPDPRNNRLPLVVPDLVDFDVPLLAGTELRSLVVVPLIVEGQLVGSLAAAAAVPDGFTDDQAAELQRFGDTVALTADRARLQASERERRGWLSYIADAGDLLAGSLDQDMTMAITGQIVVPRLAEWCAIHLLNERGKPVLQQVWHEDERQLESLREAVEGLTRDQLFGDTPLNPPYPATSIPLVARGRRTGALTMGGPRGPMPGGEFYLVAESIARRAALAIDNARAHGDLQATGRALQESLLPPTVPTAPGFDIGVVYEPAGEDAKVGGDFYDVFPAGHGTWWFVIGDVCGTGAQAAAVTGLARHTIEALARAGFPVAATLERLNTAILDEGPRARFLTLLCGTLQVEAGQVRLDLVNAGHPPPFVIHADGGVEEIGTPQLLLGVIDHVAYLPETHVLARDDLLVAVTDGVLERRDGNKMLGEGPFAEELADARHLTAQAVAERIRRIVADFTEAPQHDDMAVLAIRVQQGARRQPATALAKARAPRPPVTTPEPVAETV
jgi:serine phosphatase RsbU (regulator of sigma subunit)/PAS domain-containing protein